MPLVGVREPLAEYLYIYSKGITHHYVCSCNLMSNTYWLEEWKMLMLVLINYSEIHNYPSLELDTENGYKACWECACDARSGYAVPRDSAGAGPHAADTQITKCFVVTVIVRILSIVVYSMPQSTTIDLVHRPGGQPARGGQVDPSCCVL